jgi:hypothetical protein
VIGQIDGNKPKQLIKVNVNKDTRRYLMNGDINGSATKEKGIVPLDRLPDLKASPEYIKNQKFELAQKRNQLKVKQRDGASQEVIQ